MSDLRPLLLLLLTCLSGGIQSAEPFQAEYTVYKGETKVGEAVLSLTLSENVLRWRLETEPSGIYALLTSKRPFSESVMHKYGNDFRPISILVSISREDEPQETAHFNWAQHQIEILAEGKRTQRFLQNAVYDYLSIHWLAAEMTRSTGSKLEFDFYRRGELIRSTLRLAGQSELTIDKKKIPVNCYDQTFQSSRRKYRYCYDLNNPLLPLKIKKTKSDKKPTIMLFKKLKAGH
ncbi:MAG: DUF3108 domain-containing protein [Gammaproteobacteria bacterium]|nr:DUF3108 domain-containing protein [Gammaproteobacteria bacterium]